MSDLEAAHCPSLIKAGPALSIDLTRNEYHHSVPVLSSPLVLSLLPTQMAGTQAKTGTKITTRCRNRSPVHIGSQIYRSTRTVQWSLNRRQPRASLLTSFFISSRDACSIRPSAVSSVSPLSFSEICTKASGLNPTAAAKSKPSRLGGTFQYPLHPAEFHPRKPLWRCDCRIAGRTWGSCCRRHVRPKRDADCIILR